MSLEWSEKTAVMLATLIRGEYGLDLDSEMTLYLRDAILAGAPMSQIAKELQQ